MGTTPEFEAGYKTLNPEQKRAVDTIEGPVLVIAGPGTGKTHILTMRIARILQETQVGAESILALTFTDSAAHTMRRRLAHIIGEASARKVTITTFHGFAEKVIAENPTRFEQLADARLMGDVEEFLLFRDALLSAEVATLRPAKAPLTYLSDIKTLYGNLVREGVSLDEYRAWGKEEEKRLLADDSLRYKRGDKAGELKKDGQEKIARLEKVEEAARVLERYEVLKHERGVYDFSDLLRTAVDTIAKDEALRAELQEQFQYVLADEHQDANALQHRLLELFAYDDSPNIFVVGDEKQAIYRFQGAEQGGFDSFLDLFPKATVITLSSSFRSYQPILDAAHEVVRETGDHTELSAVRGTNETTGVFLMRAADPLEERAEVTEKIHELIDSGVAPHEIAVITRTNSLADLYALALSARGIPTLRAGDVQLTAYPLVGALISLLTYVGDPLRFDQLRAALLAPWWDVDVHDMLVFLRTTSDRELRVRLAESFPEIAARLDSFVEQAHAYTAPECFSLVLEESGARDYFLSHAEHLDELVVVRALMMHLEEVTALNLGQSFSVSLATLVEAIAEGLSPVKVTASLREGFVSVLTAHKAKGMEFQYVFVPDATENAWEKGGRPGLLPTPFDTKQSLDDARRLFYVALTRAKDAAFISYASETSAGRERKPSVLIPPNLKEVEIDAAPLPAAHEKISAPKLVRELSRAYLEQEALSPSAVNEFLESPATFFAHRILRLREPSEGPVIFGSAVHAAAAALLEGQGEEAARTAFERVFSRSLLLRDAVYEKLRTEAKEVVDALIDQRDTLGEPKHIEKAFRTTREIEGVPVALEGKLDAVLKDAEGTFVVDFKTGSSVSAKNENYVRQLALYAHLLEENEEAIDGALLIGLSADGVKRVPVAADKDAQAKALEDVDTMVRELLSGEWHQGAPSAYDALLKLLTERP